MKTKILLALSLVLMYQHRASATINPLHVAIEQNDTKLVERYLDGLNEPGTNNTPGHWAAYNGALDVLAALDKRRLLTNNVYNAAGLTSLHMAVYNPNKNTAAAIRFLAWLSNTNINAPCKQYKSTPLHYAVMCGNATAVNALLAFNTIDINAVNTNGQTCLDMARTGGHTAVEQILLADKRLHCVQDRFTGNNQVMAVVQEQQEEPLSPQKNEPTTPHSTANSTPSPTPSTAPTAENDDTPSPISVDYSDIQSADTTSDDAASSTTSEDPDSPSLQPVITTEQNTANDQASDPFEELFTEIRTTGQMPAKERLVKFIQDYPDCINKQCENCTLLFTASLLGAVNLVKVLLNAGADATITGLDDRTPLEAANVDHLTTIWKEQAALKKQKKRVQHNKPKLEALALSEQKAIMVREKIINLIQRRDKQSQE